MFTSRSRFLPIRGLQYHVREWGGEGTPKLFLLHGWMDVSASFQFLVEKLCAEWHVIAPDWRGFGRSQWSGDSYWFPDYLGDLDALLRVYCPDSAVRLVGHSLGGNVACLYAGIRPTRVAQVVALDAFGLGDMAPEVAPGRYEKWLAELSRPTAVRPFPDRAALATRLHQHNPRLSAQQADFLAQHMGEPDGHGGIRLAGDPAHRRINPVPYRRAETLACLRRVIAPTLWIVPKEPELRRRLGVSDEEHAEARACITDFREIAIADCGHNLHHDQPAEVARMIESFLLSKPS
jgi:pimeloyl-ACP methyl ester carboxylesterase